MKLFEVLITQKKIKGDKSPVKKRPILIVEKTVASAKAKATTYWGEDYSIGLPNMISDFNPK